MWTFNRLDKGRELERFFSGLPGFHDSKVINEPLCGLTDRPKLELLTAMIGFLDCTLSSDVLPDPAKYCRADICANTVDLVDNPEAFSQFLRNPHPKTTMSKYSWPKKRAMVPPTVWTLQLQPETSLYITSSHLNWNKGQPEDFLVMHAVYNVTKLDIC
jgi:hypothetical protein